MARAFSAELVCAFLLCSVFVAANASSGGSDEGSFPNRVFSVNNVEPWPVKDVSYLTTVVPGDSGDWWVELTQMKGSSVLVQVYNGSSLHTKPLSSTDLRTVGDDSKKTLMSAGGLYTIAFTCNGKRASATLQEHFVSVAPFPCVPHDPIHIVGNSEFTAENGVIGGEGSVMSPYVISGWNIDASAGIDGIKVEWTDAYFVIRECLVHSATWMGSGISFYQTSNGVVESCILSENFVGLMAFSSFSLDLRNNEFDHNLGACQFLYCTDSSFSNNVVETDNWGLAVSYSERISVVANTFDYAGISLYGLTEEEYRTNTITPDNTVGGLPIMFIKDSTVVSVVGEQYAQVIIVSCTYVHVMNMVMNGREPLRLAYVDYGTIEACEFSSVTFSAIQLDHCSNLLICNNWLHDNPGGYQALMVIDHSTSITVKDNTVERANTAALLIQHDSLQTSVIGNSISDCYEGVSLFYTSDAVVKWNTISSCDLGVYLGWSSDMVIEANTIDGCADYGFMVFEESTSNRIFHNNITNNGQQALDDTTGGNKWDDGTGCGNYWSDYSGIDADGNGIGDTPYEIDADSRDNFPMMLPWSGVVPGGLSPHDPIRITSDSEFTAENGVRSGSGTASDPFVIGGWSIDATNALGGGIEVVDTQAHFSIRNVEVYNGMGYVTNDGIHLYNNMHAVSVEDSVVTANYVGVMVSECPGVTISGNSATGGNQIGISVYASPGAIAIGNEASGNAKYGMDLANSDSVTVAENSISANGNYAMMAVECPGLHVNSNAVSMDFWGVSIRMCDNAVIEGNSLSGGYHCMAVTDSQGVIVSRNTMVGRSTGDGSCLGMWNCGGAAVTDNSLSGDLWGFWLAGGSYPTITGNYVTGNRYGIGLHSDLNSYPNIPIVGPVVSRNTVIENELVGIWLLTTCQDAVVSENIVSQNNGNGIVVDECDGTIVEGNTVSDNVGTGVMVRYLNGMGNIIVGNKLLRNGVGVSLMYTSSPSIYGNDFIGNAVQAHQDSSTSGALWDNGLSDGGNYWSDYVGADTNLDGIGDTPYLIDSTHMDRYPMMLPCVP